MKSNTKSSITLPPAELALVEKLQKRLKAASKVEVVRRGLKLLQESTERESLRQRYWKAAESVRTVTGEELQELDDTLQDGLGDD